MKVDVETWNDDDDGDDATMMMMLVMWLAALAMHAHKCSGDGGALILSHCTYHHSSYVIMFSKLMPL